MCFVHAYSCFMYIEILLYIEWLSLLLSILIGCIIVLFSNLTEITALNSISVFTIFNAIPSSLLLFFFYFLLRITFSAMYFNTFETIRFCKNLISLLSKYIVSRRAFFIQRFKAICNINFMWFFSVILFNILLRLIFIAFLSYDIE